MIVNVIHGHLSFINLEEPVLVFLWESLLSKNMRKIVVCTNVAASHFKIKPSLLVTNYKYLQKLQFVMNLTQTLVTD